MPIIEAVIGALLAALSLWTIRRYGQSTKQKLIAVWLQIAALIYVGFGVRASDSKWLLIELGGVIIYGALALLGWKRSAWFLAIGWAAHALWDVALHSGSEIWFVPRWYPAACIGFDLLVAGYAVAVLAKVAKEGI